MEEYSGRRSKTETAFLRRGSRFSSSNQSPEERTNHSSDKPRSSTRLNPVKATIANNQEGPRYLHDSFKYSSSMMAPASSSKFPLRKFEERRRQPLLPGIDIAETSRRNSEARQLEGSKKVIVDNKSSENPHREPEGFATEQIPYPECSHFTGPSGVSAHVVESSRTQRQKDKEVNLGTPGASSSTFTNRSTIPGNSTIGGRPPSGHVSGVQRRGLKNLGCSSVPDSQPPGCSSEPVIGRRFEIMRKRASDQESSSRPRSSSSGHPPPTDIRDTGPRIGTNVQLLPQQIIRRRSRNHQESAVSVRTRRSPHSARLCVPDEGVDGMLSLHESFIRNGQSAQENLSFEASAESSTRPFSVGLPHDIYSSSRRGSSNTRAERVRPSSRFEESPTQLFHGLMGQRDGHRRMTMEGITEVLAALERIEQEAELTYEQLLVLDSTLFLRAFVSHDQHRDMRMDIDNMSYEELLALEERIGSVSTALSEEQIAKCLRRSMYSQVAKEGNKSIGVDMKCSICQEEYVEGEEVGRLPCDHQYHVCCIGQWLGQKNWCPVCKASAAPPSLG